MDIDKPFIIHEQHSAPPHRVRAKNEGNVLKFSLNARIVSCTNTNEMKVHTNTNDH